MKFKRMKRSSLRIEWMKKHPNLTRIYAFFGLFWTPFVLTFGILWEERWQYKDLYEEVVGAIFLEDDLDG